MSNLNIIIGANGSSESLLQFGSKRTRMIFAEEIITAGQQRFELRSGQKESSLLTEEASHASERAVRAILSGCKTFQFHDTSSETHIRSTANMNNNRFLMNDGGNVAAYLYMLKMKYEKYYN